MKTISQTNNSSPLEYGHFNPAQEIDDIIAQGGFQKGKKESFFSNLEWYDLLIPVISIIAFVIMVVLQCSLNKSLLVGWILSVSGILYIMSKWLYHYLSGRDFFSRPANQNSPNYLETNYGIGISLSGDFFDLRCFYGSTVTYQCITFFYLPILPIGCYRVNRGKTTSVGPRRSTTSYKVYGSEKWIFLELLFLYLHHWSLAAFICSFLGTIINFF
jgi:hypothetical protein